jgi:hypothetical protein
MRIGRAQYSRFGSTMHVRGVSSVWESAGFASRRSPVRSRYAPLPFVEPISAKVAANQPFLVINHVAPLGTAAVRSRLLQQGLGRCVRRSSFLNDIPLRNDGEAERRARRQSVGTSLVRLSSPPKADAGSGVNLAPD